MFQSILEQCSWDDVKSSIYSKSRDDVINALHKEKRNLEDFKALVSPAAMPFLEDMAVLSHKITQRRFGKTIQMYIPLYVSNECQNVCTYCGFSFTNKIKRRTLTPNEIFQEAKAIKQMGFNHVLIVSGEANHTVRVEYYKLAVEILKPLFPLISLEVQPLDTYEYEMLNNVGLNTVLVYQETYHKENYRKYHVRGKKTNFNYRLGTPERLGDARMHKIGLGVLIGLEDWRTDSFFCAMHLSYMQKKYWQTKYSVSFPRLRPFSGGLKPKSIMTDAELVQLICAYRLFNEDVELSLSTRESELFRNNALKLGITSFSAGSKTNPGGYSVAPESLKQFEISDERTPKEVADMIKNSGYEPVWKDWDTILH